MSAKRKPKTHSDVLWHFTGGPLWDSAKDKQSKSLKPLKDAYKAFVSILESKELRVGSYHELISVTVPEKRYFDPEAKRIKTKKNVKTKISTSPVCCVADIPLSELFHHSKRYGKIAIGFKRKSLVKAKFNPVFYTFENQQISLNYYKAQHALESVDTSSVESEVESLEGDIESQLSDHPNLDVNIDTSSVINEVEFLTEYSKDALSALEDSMAFIKTFSASEFDTIYSEREWRSTNPYRFTWNDIEALIVPQENNFLDNFICNDSKKLKVPKEIKIHTWESITDF